MVVNERLDPVETAYRASGSDITIVLEKNPQPLINLGDEPTEGQAAQWARRDVVTRRTLPGGRVAVTLAYLTPDVQEETARNSRLMLD